MSEVEQSMPRLKPHSSEALDDLPGLLDAHPRRKWRRERKHDDGELVRVLQLEAVCTASVLLRLKGDQQLRHFARHPDPGVERIRLRPVREEHR